MDRGIKIAIVAACVLSLGLGLLWDKVIDASRSVISDADSSHGMAPDPLHYRVGDHRTPLAAGTPTTEKEAAASALHDAPLTDAEGEQSQAQPTPTVSTTSGGPLGKLPKSVVERIKDGKYRLQRDDSPWKLANAKGKGERFYKWGTESKDWADANPGVRWAEDTWVSIPPFNAERSKTRE